MVRDGIGNPPYITARALVYFVQNAIAINVLVANISE
jgi:hypothetical protein